MGVLIYLNIMPSHIDEAEWEKVYKETLEIISGYPFVDSIFDNHTYDCNWKYLTRTKESVVNFKDNQIGWHTFGDEISLRLAESFVLIKDLQYYRNNSRRDVNCEDILFSSIYNYPALNEHLERLAVDEVRVFDAKTQGEPFHIPMLAIACLIESRFPQYAIVNGDITIGQMEKAVKWANTILKHPIALTDRADNEKLLMRIKNEVKDEVAALEALMNFTIQKRDMELGKLVRMQFRPETIAAYYLSNFKNHNVETYGFRDELTNYINQGFRLEDACELCVLDLNGCNYDANSFAQSVLSMEWATKGQNLVDPISTKINAPNSAEPETVSSMLGKTFLQMSGFQESMESNLSFEQVVRILRAKLGSFCDIELLVGGMNEGVGEEEDYTALLDEFHEKFGKFAEAKEVVRGQYTIMNVEDLIAWKSGDTIHPGLKKRIVGVKEFVEQLLKEDKEFFARFQEMTEKDKMRKLIQSNRFFYIHKRVWDELSVNMNDSEIMNKVLGVLSIKAEEININKLCKYLVNNQELFKAFIL